MAGLSAGVLGSVYLYVLDIIMFRTNYKLIYGCKSAHKPNCHSLILLRLYYIYICMRVTHHESEKNDTWNELSTLPARTDGRGGSVGKKKKKR